MTTHNPFEHFKRLYTEFLKFSTEHDRPHGDAMTLVSCTREGVPSARIVLLKGLTPEGKFNFYTNYNSQKSKELIDNPKAQLLFFWPDLGMQIRISGNILKTSTKESDEYWFSRSRESRIGAIASKQSSKLTSLGNLQKEVLKVESEMNGKEVNRPENWGGFSLEPYRYEFWKEGMHRLHERKVYEWEPEKRSWNELFLYP